MTLLEKPSKELPRAIILDSNNPLIRGRLKELKIIPVNKEKSTLIFTGYSIVKSHVVKFNDWEGNLYFDGSEIKYFEGKIKSNSVSTGIEMLDNHLKNNDFFDIEKFPEILFSGFVAKDDMKGGLNFRGILKEISFPVKLDSKSISSEFYLDITPFKIKYIGVNKEIKVKFEIYI